MSASCKWDLGWSLSQSACLSMGGKREQGYAKEPLKSDPGGWWLADVIGSSFQSFEATIEKSISPMREEGEQEKEKNKN